MKKLFLPPLALILLISKTFSQPDIQWQKCLGGTSTEVNTAIRQTSDGNFIATGYSYSNDGDVSGHHGNNYYADYWIVKFNQDTIWWQKSLGGTYNELAQDIQPTSDHGYVATGYSESNDGNVSGNHGLHDFWTVKLDSNAVLKWQKCYGGSYEDEGSSVTETDDDAYVAAGFASSNDGNVSGNHGFDDFWIVKMAALNGALLWQKPYGGTSDDVAKSIQQTPDHGFVVAGYTFSNNDDVTGNHGNADYWILKLDSAGTMQWEKCYGGSMNEFPASIQLTADGGYVVAGYAQSSDSDLTLNHGSFDYWIIKIDSAGTLQWQTSLGGSDDDEAFSVQQTSDGGYITAGFTASTDGDVTNNIGLHDYWVVKLDSAGIMEWQKCLGGSEYDDGSCVIQTADGALVISGSTHSIDGDVSGNHSAYSTDYWVVNLATATGTGVSASPNDVKIFPNPASNQITISKPPSPIDELECFDVVGRKCLSKDFHLHENSISIDVSQLPSGIYTLRVKYRDGVLTQKFVKQ